MKSVAVIGAGAAGLMAAIAAAESGARVDLFDALDAPGRKILATGNGRCNLTNLNQGAAFYHSSSCNDVMAFFKDCGSAQLRHFFVSGGTWLTDRGGYVYPRTERASTILQALLSRIRVLPVDLHPGERITEVGCSDRSDTAEASFEQVRCGQARNLQEQNGTQTGAGRDSGACLKDEGAHTGRFVMKGRHSGETYHFDAVILTTGGKAGTAFGCRGDGYRIAASFGHTLVPPLPALTTLTVSDPQMKILAGVRAKAGIRLLWPEGEASGGWFDNNADALLSNSSNGAGAPAAAFGETACADFASARNKLGCMSASGEIQFAEGALSGIPVFQVSGAAAQILQMHKSGDRQQSGAKTCEQMQSRPGANISLKKNYLNRKNYSRTKNSAIAQNQNAQNQNPAIAGNSYLTAEIDCLPEFSEEMWQNECRVRLSRAETDTSMTAAGFFEGLVHPAIASYIIRSEGIADEKKLANLRERRDEILQRFMYRLRHLQWTVTGTGGFERAQVTRGGVSLAEVDCRMESKLQKGLFLAGELLDQDGLCGGYNLTWAMCTGMIAGRSAAQ